MLEWSPGAVKATVGVGGLGLMALLMGLLSDAGLPQPFAIVFPVAFAPMMVFMLTGGLAARTWARRAQAVAVVWYAVAATAGLAGALHRGMPRHDLFFLAFVAVGAWPCIVAARALACHAHADAHERASTVLAVDASHAPGDRVVVLNGARRKWVRAFIVMAVFCAIGFMPGYQRDNPTMAWATVVFCGFCAAMALAQLLLPAARGTLTLDTHGFEVRTFGRRHRTHWHDVAGFRLMNISGASMISLAYRPTYERQRSGRLLAAGLTGVEGAIPDNYEVQGAALVALLESWRALFGSDAPPPDHASTAPSVADLDPLPVR